MNLKNKVGTFRVISSFTISRKKEFYLIGELLDGSLSMNNYVNIILNSSLVLSEKISSIENVEIANDNKVYQLIVIESSEDEMNDFLFCLNVDTEIVYITLSGED